MPGAKQSVVINTPAKIIYDVVCDFEKYPNFLPESRQVSVLEKNAKSIIAEFEIKVIKTLVYTLKFHLSPHKKITWSFIEGNLFKDNKGTWSFKEVNKECTEATYEVDIELGILVPGAITRMLVGSNLPQMLAAFKKRAEGLYKKKK